jgi:hypothetical protein
VLVRDLDRTPYDDAYFFLRFARNFLQHAGFAWNPGDGPVHGLTSQLFQLVAVALAALAPDHAIVAAKIVLAACLGSTAWFLVRLCERLSGRYDIALVVTLLSVGCPLALWTMHSGMETGIAFLVVTLALRAVVAPPPGSAHAPKAALVTVFAYVCRPDLALLPAVAFVVETLGDRRRVALYAVSLGALLGALLLAFHAYYGTALPLPFYAKTRGFAGDDAALRELGAHDKLVHLVTFAAFAGPLFALTRPLADRRALALVAASAVFVAYHAFVTNEIMGYRARFYAPALIPLALAAALGARRALDATRARRVLWLLAGTLAFVAAHRFGLLATAHAASLERIAWPAFAVSLVLAGWLALSEETGGRGGARAEFALALYLLGLLAALPPRAGRLLDDRAFVERSSAEVTTTRGIFDVERCLPKDATVYHSEVGVPGIVLPGARIVDLAGLMSREIALGRPTFDALCGRERPQAIFLPHRNYVERNREVLASDCIAFYTRVVQRSSSPLYVRKDLARNFLGCARDVGRYH